MRSRSRPTIGMTTPLAMDWSSLLHCFESSFTRARDCQEPEFFAIRCSDALLLHSARGIALLRSAMNADTELSEKSRPELTIRGLIVGVIITLVFTAANVYFGLKAGLTFSTSIPAAVISMAILRGFRDASVQENNIVQTVASAAGTLSSIIFVLPGLIMIG